MIGVFIKSSEPHVRENHFKAEGTILEVVANRLEVKDKTPLKEHLRVVMNPKRILRRRMIEKNLVKIN